MLDYFPTLAMKPNQQCEEYHCWKRQVNIKRPWQQIPRFKKLRLRRRPWCMRTTTGVSALSTKTLEKNRPVKVSALLESPLLMLQSPEKKKWRWRPKGERRGGGGDRR